MGRDHLLEFASDFLRAPEWGAPETTEPLPCWHRAVNRVSSKDNNLLPRIKRQRAGEPEHFIREPSCVTGKGRPLLTNGPSHLSFSSNDGYDIAYWRHDRRLSDMGLAISELWKPVDRAPILPTAGASGPGKEAGCRSARDSGLRAGLERGSFRVVPSQLVEAATKVMLLVRCRRGGVFPGDSQQCSNETGRGPSDANGARVFLACKGKAK
ncbi:hypothetical protein HPB48_025115 [Haemaphysalis longicornis]|uniref:Uncharacterized protein n=1 Tax=Haemaphysalis longicornis TaxID=44386 RepID=A0A9J6GYQ3_HAELO|nr:hypothetical protein HPB48_025115 [Haemaphysalis longicornis]